MPHLPVPRGELSHAILAALAAEILWGARALVELEGRVARRLIDAWEAGRSSLLAPLPELALR